MENESKTIGVLNNKKENECGIELEGQEIRVNNEEYSEEELVDIIQQIAGNKGADGERLIEPLQMDVDNISQVQFNERGFDLGVENASSLCGEITALKNTGLDNKSIVDILVSIKTIEHKERILTHELKIAKLKNITMG